jgi:hypothetical protein
LLGISAGQHRRAQADREARAGGYRDTFPNSGQFLPEYSFSGTRFALKVASARGNLGA